MMSFFKQALQAIGEFQSRLILTLFYGVVMLPFALIARLVADPLGLREFRSAPGGTWKKRTPVAGTLEEAQQQY